jgi:hypothetical protein
VDVHWLSLSTVAIVWIPNSFERDCGVEIGFVGSGVEGKSVVAMLLDIVQHDAAILLAWTHTSFSLSVTGRRMSLRERRNGLTCQNQACDQQVRDWRGSMQSHHAIEYKRVAEIEALLEVSGGMKAELTRHGRRFLLSRL